MILNWYKDFRLETFTQDDACMEAFHEAYGFLIGISFPAFPAVLILLAFSATHFQYLLYRYK